MEYDVVRVNFAKDYFTKIRQWGWILDGWVSPKQGCLIQELRFESSDLISGFHLK